MRGLSVALSHRPCSIAAHSLLTRAVIKKAQSVINQSQGMYSETLQHLISITLHSATKHLHPFSRAGSAPYTQQQPGRTQTSAIRGKKKKKSHLMTPDCLWLIRPAFVYQISILCMFEGSYFKMLGWPSRNEADNDFSVSVHVCPCGRWWIASHRQMIWRTQEWEWNWQRKLLFQNNIIIRALHSGY